MKNGKLKNRIINEMKELEEVRIFTMSFNIKTIEDIAKANRDANIKLYVSKDKYLDQIGSVQKLKELDNLEIITLENNHIKGLFGKKDQKKEFFSVFGSSNFTERGLYYKNYEFNLDLDSENDNIKDLKYSNSSIIQGFVKGLNKQLKQEKIKDKFLKRFENKRISKNPVKFLDGKEYGKKLLEESEKILSEKELEPQVVVISPNINFKILDELFGEYQPNMYVVSNKFKEEDKKKIKEKFENVELKEVKDTHAKMILIENTHEHFIGFGSSNISFSGLGFADGYLKNELNFTLKIKTETYDRTINLFKNPVKYYESKIFKTMGKLTEILVLHGINIEETNIDNIKHCLPAILKNVDELTRESILCSLSNLDRYHNKLKEIENIIDLAKKNKRESIRSIKKLVFEELGKSNIDYLNKTIITDYFLLYAHNIFNKKI